MKDLAIGMAHVVVSHILEHASDHTGVSRAFRSKNMPRFGEKKGEEKEKIQKPVILITSGKNSMIMPYLVILSVVTCGAFFVK